MAKEEKKEEKGIDELLAGFKGFKRKPTKGTVAIRINPDYAVQYQNRAIAYSKNGDRVNAESDFAKAKELGYKP